MTKPKTGTDHVFARSDGAEKRGLSLILLILAGGV